MSNGTVFYSWQSDIEKKHNRFFIEECLEQAIKKIGKEIKILYNLDRDTKNTDGTPDIASTIFEKINSCQLFVADITIINSNYQDLRKTPNPNVLVELGYAAGKIGWDKIICIFNSAYGNIEELPFDIKFRRILSYKFNSESDKKLVKEQLINVFEIALKKIDLDEIQRLYEINEKFSKEPEHIRTIAIEKKDYWEFELMSKLLKRRFSTLDDELEKIEDGFIFGKRQKLNSQECLNFIGEGYRRMIEILDKINILINQKFPEAIGNPGISGDAIKIKKVADFMFLLLNEIVGFESDLNKIIIPKNMMKVKKLMDGWAKEFIEQFRKIPYELEKVYSGHYKDGDRVNVKLNISSFETTDELLILFKEFNNNPYLVIDEYEDE